MVLAAAATVAAARWALRGAITAAVTQATASERAALEQARAAVEAALAQVRGTQEQALWESRRGVWVAFLLSAHTLIREAERLFQADDGSHEEARRALETTLIEVALAGPSDMISLAREVEDCCRELSDLGYVVGPLMRANAVLSRELDREVGTRGSLTGPASRAYEALSLLRHHESSEDLSKFFQAMGAPVNLIPESPRGKERELYDKALAALQEVSALDNDSIEELIHGAISDRPKLIARRDPCKQAAEASVERFAQAAREHLGTGDVSAL